MIEEIKASTVFFSLFGGIFMIILGIISFVEYQRISEKCNYLQKQVKEQSTLIEYLKGDKNE